MNGGYQKEIKRDFFSISANKSQMFLITMYEK